MNSTAVPAQATMHRSGPIPATQHPEMGSKALGRVGSNPSQVPESRSSRAKPPGVGRSTQAGTIRNLSFSGPAGRLEALLNLGAANAPFAALVCHPHPVFGGNLHNKVVYHAMKALNAPEWGIGWPVLRFNFRGAGMSQGVHDGEAESGDVLAALAWLEREFQRPLVVVGFSFGAAMALRACCRPKPPHHDVRALVALGLPVQVEGPAYEYSFLENLTLPKLFLSGDRDPFSPPAELAQVVATAAEPKRLISLPGADHFFTGQLEPMQQAIADWMKEQLL